MDVKKIVEHVEADITALICDCVNTYDVHPMDVSTIASIVVNGYAGSILKSSGTGTTPDELLKVIAEIPFKKSYMNTQPPTRH